MDENEFEYREINFRDYWRIVVKRRWLIIAFFLIVVTVTALSSLTATPIYQAKCQILIERTNPGVLNPIEMITSDYNSPEFYQTQYKILESRTLARDVIRRLNLTSNREFVSEESSRKQQLNIGNAEGGNAEKADSSLEDSLVGAFLGRLQVAPIRNSHLVDVLFEAKDPFLAAKIANTTAKAYIDWNLGLRLQAQKESANFLDEQVKEQKQKLEVSEQALQQYREKFGVVALNPRGTGKEAETTESTQKMLQVSSQMIDAQQKRIEAEIRYKKALELVKNPDQAESIPEVVNNPLINQIKNQEVDLMRKKTELAEKFGQKHPTMVALIQEMDNLQKKKVKEIRNIVSFLKSQYDIALSQEASLRTAAGRSRSETLSQNKVAIQYQVLQQETESNRALYDMLLKRLKETNVSEENRMVSISVVDKAEVPKSTSRPRTRRNIMLAMVIGLMGGLGLAFFFEYLDNTVKTPEDVERYLNLPYLGPIPSFEVKDEDPTHDMVVLNSPKSSASESFRGLRTNILFSSAQQVPRVILVTSATAKEGKTLVSSNLAIAMAQGGGKILILDCDMRRPRMHKLFEVPRDPGMSNILIGEASWEKMIQPTGIENLWIIPSGPIPPNPAELVSSDLMASLVETLRGQFDRVIIDSPPIMAVTDSVAMARLTDGLVMVIKVGTTARDVITGSLRQLRDMNAKILGIVLNDIPFSKDHYYYSQHYYYYYGEEGQREKRKKLSRKEKKIDKDQGPAVET